MGMLQGWLLENRLYLLLAIGAVGSFLWLLNAEKRLKMKWYAALAVSILHTVFGVFSVKIFAFLENVGSDTQGNMSLFGGVFFMPVLYFIGAKVFKKDLADVYDVMTFPMIFTVMCARVNCLFAGCCLGIHIHGEDSMRVPARELEILFYIVLLIILSGKILKGKTYGTAYPLYMMCYGAFRFIIEFFRESTHVWGIFHISHLWAILSLGIGTVFFLLLSKRKAKLIAEMENAKRKNRKKS